MKELDLYDVNLKYIRDLQKVDSNVMSQSPQIGKSTRPYVGIIVMLNEQKYCIPLSSGNKDKYQKKSKIDLIKIPDLEHKNRNGAPKTLAVLNVNNMIPVHDSVIKKKNLKIHKNDTLDERQEKGFLQKELQWCRDNHDLIVRRAQKVYSFVVDMPEKDKSLTHRCCDFKKLESVLKKRLSKSVEQNKVTQTKSTSNEKPQYTFAGIRHAKMEKDARKAAQPPVKPVPGISKPKRDGIDD